MTDEEKIERINRDRSELMTQIIQIRRDRDRAQERATDFQFELGLVQEDLRKAKMLAAKQAEEITLLRNYLRSTAEAMEEVQTNFELLERGLLKKHPGIPGWTYVCLNHEEKAPYLLQR